MTKKRLATLGALTALLFTSWRLLGASEAPTAFEAKPAAALTPAEPPHGAEQTTSPAVERAEHLGSRPAARPVSPATPTQVPTGAPRLAVALAQQQAWLPPSPSDLVFDLDGDHRVEPDERARATELLERAHQFAANRATDGTYPILKRDFRGEGRLFRAMDDDGDGALSEREFVAFEADSIRQLRRYDQNADGALSKAEFGHLDARFDFLDEDHDGELYAWEITLMRGRGKW